VAVEHNAALADGLREQQRRTLYATPENFHVECADFLDLTPAHIGKFDVVVMNPPFENAVDVRHIQHARGFLKPNGVLVAICARGPRQIAALQPEAEHWEELPAGTFAGTSVNAAILTMRAE
jgi:16S rRNA G1207 methylase RsmC